MATDIRNFLNSDYIDNSNKLRKKPVIQVYVENNIDKAFWSSILSAFEEKINCQFRIYTICERGKFLTGKRSIFTYKQESYLGKNMWICIDSDYDELIKDYSPFSEMIRHNKYVITTWWYSIENLKCYPKLLRENLMKVSLIDRCDVDLNEILSNISKLYEEIFLLLLEMKEKHDDRFKIDDFCECLSFVSYKECALNVQSVKSKIDEWKNNHIDWFNQYGNSFSEWKKKLKAVGFFETDYYQLYKGHGVFDKIAVPMVEYFSDKYRDKYIEEIKNGADSEDRKKQLISEYYKATFASKKAGSLRSRIIQLITDNTPDYNCSASVKIREQIENALA